MLEFQHNFRITEQCLKWISKVTNHEDQKQIAKMVLETVTNSKIEATTLSRKTKLEIVANATTANGATVTHA